MTEYSSFGRTDAIPQTRRRFYSLARLNRDKMHANYVAICRWKDYILDAAPPVSRNLITLARKAGDTAHGSAIRILPMASLAVDLTPAPAPKPTPGRLFGTDRRDPSSPSSKSWRRTTTGNEASCGSRSPSGSSARWRRPRKAAKQLLLKDRHGRRCAERLCRMEDQIIRDPVRVREQTSLPVGKSVRSRAHGGRRDRRLWPRPAWRPAPTSICCSCCPTNRPPGASRSPRRSSIACGTPG